MKYYYFSGDNHINPHSNIDMKLLEESGFSGALFAYSSYQEDYFTQIARNINLSHKIKYMVAVRPYTISPQYLRKINQSIEKIMPNRLQINLISGHIKEEEINFGGVLGSVDDTSSNIERSNYMMDYLLELDKINKKHPFINQPDIFVSTTNKEVFKFNISLNNKMIIPYEQFKEGGWITKNIKDSATLFGEPFTLNKKQIMLFIVPIIRENQKDINYINKTKSMSGIEYFTYESFYDFIKVIKSAGIEHLMLCAKSNGEESENIIKMVKMLTSSNVLYNEHMVTEKLKGDK